MLHKQVEIDKLTDILDYSDAIQNLKASKSETVSREDVLKELGLDDLRH